MNIHHLELFEYVARHGGISEAVRNIPYGIQQPAAAASKVQKRSGNGTKFPGRCSICRPAKPSAKIFSGT